MEDVSCYGVFLILAEQDTGELDKPQDKKRLND